MDEKTKILAVFAHADDEVVCGWPLMQDSKAERYLLTVCQGGERGSVLRKVCRREGIRLVEHKLDIKPRFSLDRGGVMTVQIGRMVAEAVRGIKPDYVFTHNQWGEYGHPDHILLSQLVRNYVARVKVVTSNLDIPSKVWIKQKSIGPDTRSVVNRDEGFWERSRSLYGKYWTTNEYINNGNFRTAGIMTAGPDVKPVRLVRELVVWLCDIDGWAFSNMADSVGGELGGYVHRKVFLQFDTAQNKWYYSAKDAKDIERASVIVAMTPAAVRFLPNNLIRKVVLRVSGVRRFAK